MSAMSRFRIPKLLTIPTNASKAEHDSSPIRLGRSRVRRSQDRVGGEESIYHLVFLT